MRSTKSATQNHRTLVQIGPANRRVTASAVRCIRSTETIIPLRPCDSFLDQPVRILRRPPAQHLDPFAGLEILVVLEEVLDLLQRDLGQVAVGLDTLS